MTVELWADDAHALWPDEPRTILLSEIRAHSGSGLGEPLAWAVSRVPFLPHAGGHRLEPVAMLPHVADLPETAAPA